MEWLAGLKALVGAKVAAAGLAAGLGLLAVLMRKKLAPMLAKWLGGRIDLLLNPNTQDPVEKELIRKVVLDVVKLAEYKLPDAGKGKERYALAAAKLCRFFPMLAGQEDKIQAMIEEAVKAMDEELKKKAGG